MKSTKQRVAVICILLLAVGWWWQSWNFDDRFVAGEYVAENSGECNGLVLNSDHSFSEEVWKDDRSTTPTTGNWRRFGQAGVALSKSFIGATPKAVANDNVYGMLDNHIRISYFDNRSANDPC
jgi:hypothetical protein